MGRLDPPQMEELTDQQKEIYAAITRSRPRVSGPFGVWLRIPRIAEAANKLVNSIRDTGKIDKREYEFIVMIVAAFLLRGTGDEKTARLQEFTLAAMLFSMASPIAWVHHYNVLLPAYVIALKGALERQSRGYVCLAAVLLAISYGLTGFRLAPPYAPTVAGFSLVQSHVLIGAWILLGVLIAQSRFQPKVT